MKSIKGLAKEWEWAMFWRYSLKVYIIRKPSSSCLGIECSRYIKTMMDLLKKALSYLTRQRHWQQITAQQKALWTSWTESTMIQRLFKTSLRKWEVLTLILIQGLLLAILFKRKLRTFEKQILTRWSYYNFAAEVDNIQQSIGIKGSVLKKGTYIANEEMIKAKLHTVFDRFKDDPYFQFIYGADYESYFSKPGVTKARDCLKGNTAYSILSAYKLFYVGCSRARRNLTILLDSSKIKGNLEPQKKRFEEIGFQVVSSPIH